MNYFYKNKSLLKNQQFESQVINIEEHKVDQQNESYQRKVELQRKAEYLKSQIWEYNNLVKELDHVEIDYTMTGDDALISKAKKLYGQICMLRSQTSQFSRDLAHCTSQLKNQNDF